MIFPDGPEAGAWRCPGMMQEGGGGNSQPSFTRPRPLLTKPLDCLCKHKYTAIMLTTKEVAKRLGTTTDNVRMQIHSGRIKAKKMGRDWFVSEKEVERYRREHQTNGRSARWKDQQGDQE